MKITLKKVMIALVIICALAVYPIMHIRDISVTNSTTAPYITAEHPTLNTELKSIDFTVTNPCYYDTSIRETVVLSVFDEQGIAVALNGTSAVLSAFDLVSEDNMLIKGKSVQDNQAVYNIGEYTLGAAEHRYPLFKQEPSSAEASRVSSYTLYSDRTLPEYADCILRIDVIVEYSADGNTWTRANDVTVYLANSADADISALSGEVVIPEITPAPSFEWSIENGTAVLVGIGEITDADITIPAYIRLDEAGCEDPNGEIYPIVVKSNAFLGNVNLVSVTFADDVSVENGDMSSMFSGCTSLTEVNNIPDNVTIMNSTFSGCTALVEAPMLPEGVLDMSNCFRDCTTLEYAPLLPDTIEHMDGTFVNCTSLTQAPTIPNTVSSINYCFSGCSSLDGTLTLPYAAISKNIYSRAPSALYMPFYNCTSLDVIALNICPNHPYNKNELDTDLPVIYLQEHNDNGLCEHCNLINGFEYVDDIAIYADDVKSELYYAYVDFIDNEIPDILKEYCTRIYLISDIEKYAGKCLAGFAVNYGGYSYIYVQIDHIDEKRIKAIDYIFYHEFGHSYDFQHGTSGSSAWRSIFQEEGENLAAMYGPGGYSLGETFAVATGYYFTGLEDFKTDCPLAYEFMDNLFGDLD